MATLKIEKKGPTLFGFKLTRPTGTTANLSFDAAGKCERSLAAAGEYQLDWMVRGAEGTEFSFKASLDDTVLKNLPKTPISAAQFEAGNIPFAVEGA